jgi:hypothetical protein
MIISIYRIQKYNKKYNYKENPYKENPEKVPKKKIIKCGKK